MTFKTTTTPLHHKKKQKTKRKHFSVNLLYPTKCFSFMGNGRIPKWSLSLGNSYGDDIHSKAVCMLAGFRLETRWRTEDHSGTVYRRTMDMYTYVHVHRQHRIRNNLNIKPARCFLCKAFKVVLETNNITVQKIMQQYNNM